MSINLPILSHLLAVTSAVVLILLTTTLPQANGSDNYDGTADATSSLIPPPASTIAPRITYVQLPSASSGISNLTSAATTTQETRDIITQVQNECIAEQVSPIGCVWPIYESPTTVVFEGDIIVDGQGGVSNKWIWKVVDNLKGRGFVIESITLAGQGSVGNPHKFEIVMSKSP